MFCAFPNLSHLEVGKVKGYLCDEPHPRKKLWVVLFCEGSKIRVWSKD